MESSEKMPARDWTERREEALKGLRGEAEWVGRIVHEEPVGFGKA